MLPQHRMETLEDCMLYRFQRGIEYGLLNQFRLKLNDAINSVLVFGQYFDENSIKLAASLYKSEQEVLNQKRGYVCDNFILPETQIQTLENKLIAEIVALVKCSKELRSPNVERGGLILVNFELLVTKFGFRIAQKRALQASIKEKIEELKTYDSSAASKYECIKNQEHCINFLKTRGLVFEEHNTNLIDIWSLYCRQYEELTLIPKEIKRFSNKMLQYAEIIDRFEFPALLGFDLYKATKITKFKNIAKDADNFLHIAQREIIFTHLSLKGESPFPNESEFYLGNTTNHKSNYTH